MNGLRAAAPASINRDKALARQGSLVQMSRSNLQDVPGTSAPREVAHAPSMPGRAL